MSQDSYTEVTTTSWMTRLGNSFKGIVTGIILIVLSSALLYWNEGRTVRRAGAIGEAELVTVDLPSIASVDPSFNGKVVYALGEAKTTETLADSLFDVSATAIKLDRKVKFYQWIEKSETKTEKKLGGGEEKVTTYTYEKAWVDAPVNSSSFKISEGHENSLITLTPLENEKWQAQTVTFGAYKLSKAQIASVYNPQNIDLEFSKEQLDKINAMLVKDPQTLLQEQQLMQNNQMVTGYNQGMQAPNTAMQTTTPNMPVNQNMSVTPTMNMQTMQTIPVEPRVHVQGNQIYLGKSSGTPSIGDIIVTYTKTTDTNISIIAQVNGNSFVPYTASNGNTFSSLSNSQSSKQEMFQSAKDSNTMISWLLRVLGIFLVIGGFKAIFAPLAVLADVIPVLGSIVGAGTGLAASLIGFAWSFIIIAIAWIRFRPILGLSLLGIALIAIIFTIWKGKSNKNDKTPTPQEPQEA